jgi:hypothetical protein
MPGAWRTCSFVCRKGRWHTSVVTTGLPYIRHSPRNGFNGGFGARDTPIGGSEVACHRVAVSAGPGASHQLGDCRPGELRNSLIWDAMSAWQRHEIKLD